MRAFYFRTVSSLKKKKKKQKISFVKHNMQYKKL